MRFLIAFLIVLIVVVQFKYVLKSPPDFHIIQTSLSQMNPDLFFEKQPIVIDDRIEKVDELVKTVFKFYYTNQSRVSVPSEIVSDPEMFRQVLAKNIVVYNSTEEKQTVRVLHPKHQNELQFLKLVEKTYAYRLGKMTEDNSPRLGADIILHPHQTLILPCNWIYQVNTVMEEIALYDFLYGMASYFRSK
jgi:hypothetical protein